MLHCLRKLGLLMCTDNTREVSVAHEFEINCMDGNLYHFIIICDVIEKKKVMWSPRMLACGTQALGW